MTITRRTALLRAGAAVAVIGALATEGVAGW